MTPFVKLCYVRAMLLLF